jgi:hypothetical protein
MASAPPARAPQAKSARVAVAGGKNGNTRRSVMSPASWEKIMTGITDDRRDAKPRENRRCRTVSPREVQNQW